MMKNDELFKKLVVVFVVIFSALILVNLSMTLFAILTTTSVDDGIVSLDDTIISVTGINSTVNISFAWVFDMMIVESNSLFVENLTGSHPNQVGSESMTFNFTETNKSYDGTEFPYFSASSSTSKTIKSNLAQPIVITALIGVSSCSEEIIFTSALGSSSTVVPETCSDSTGKALVELEIRQGVSSLTIGAVSAPSTGGGPGGGYAPEEHVISDEEFKIGFGRNVPVNSVFKFNVAGESHTLTVKKIFQDRIVIEILSGHLIELTLDVGDSVDVDVDGDGENDMTVELRGISFAKADIFISASKQPIPGEPEEPGAPIPGEPEEKKGLKLFDIIIISVTVLVILIIIILIILVRRKESVTDNKVEQINNLMKEGGGRFKE